MRSKVLFVLVLLLGLSSLCSAKDLSKALPPRFRDWLKKDVVYIITNEGWQMEHRRWSRSFGTD